MTSSPSRTHGGSRRAPGAVAVALLLLSAVVLTLAAAHAMCIPAHSRMSGPTAVSEMGQDVTAHVASAHVSGIGIAAATATHSMLGLLDCVMAGIACLLIALLLVGLLRPRHIPAARGAESRPSRGPPRLRIPTRAPSLTVLCVSRT
ncbi:hypothetical protein QDR37_00445 [Amnibacterium sp. CER49]|uniref:hypothetical protein n=1 Tax=Amnibacterium sp. CER49 TaxID=3039161 RepID=UPI00244B88B6|nr:hypothetical protein [Amnibacterium sp. CER49]MDH2442405.1 hypothetical protein [Amnibacterium sp. CER49]